MGNLILQNQDWYNLLINDLRSTLVEGMTTAKEIVLETKWSMGFRLLQDEDKDEEGLTHLLTRVSVDAGFSEREIWRCVAFAREYPGNTFREATEIKPLPEGKNISWHKICNKYLPLLKKKIVLPKGKYGVILADPPWPYPERQDAKNLYGNANYHYGTMSIKDLCSLDIGDLAAENSVLFLWTTTNFLEKAFEVINSWKFSYKSNYVWVKDRASQLGFYGNIKHEHLLIATKGSYLPKTTKLPSSVMDFLMREHSQKPDEVYDIIEKLYPDDKYIELFLRGKPHSDKWIGWGLEAK